MLRAVFILMCLGLSSPAWAGVRLDKEPLVELPSVQACLRVDAFSFDRQAAQNKKTAQLSWKLKLKSSCLKHQQVKLFYELLSAEGEPLAYKPLGELSVEMPPGAYVDVAKSVPLQQDPMGLKLKFQAVVKATGSKQLENYTLYMAHLTPEVMPKPVIDPIVERKKELKACYKDFVVNMRAIAENWRLTHMWWQVTHPEPTTCKKPIYTQMILRDKDGKVLERSDIMKEQFTKNRHNGFWHKEPVRTKDYTEAKTVDVILQYKHAVPETIFKRMSLTPPELENW